MLKYNQFMTVQDLQVKMLNMLFYWQLVLDALYLWEPTILLLQILKKAKESQAKLIKISSWIKCNFIKILLTI